MATAGLTWLQLVNRVLARLREGSVATVSESVYSTFIGALLNQVKSEMEQAYYWNSLRDTYAISTEIGTTSYAFSGAGPEAVVISGWNTSTPGILDRGTNADFDAYFFGTTDVQTGTVAQYLPAGVNADYDLKIDVWPEPDSVQELKFNVFKPQADLSDDADIALVPQSVLLEETLARAMNERGDEAAPKPMPGETWILKDLLASAIARESGHDDDEMQWVPE